MLQYVKKLTINNGQRSLKSDKNVEKYRNF